MADEGSVYRQLIHAVVQAHRSRLPIWLVGRAARPQTEWGRQRQEPGGRRRWVQGDQDDLRHCIFAPLALWH